MINIFIEKWLKESFKSDNKKGYYKGIFMRKIAILNFNGGTGKTTAVANLSYVLSLKDYKVLIIPIRSAS
jgi:Mrp family chromosome partitioning ATPase